MRIVQEAFIALWWGVLFGTAGCGLVIAGKLTYAVYLISEGIGNDPDMQQHIGCVVASAILTKHLSDALFE